MEKLTREFKSRGLQVIALDIYRNDMAVKYARDKRFAFAVIFWERSGVYQNNPICRAFGINDMPTTYLVDGSGRVLFADCKYDEEDLRAALAKLGLR